MFCSAFLSSTLLVVDTDRGCPDRLLLQVEQLDSAVGEPTAQEHEECSAKGYHDSLKGSCCRDFYGNDYNGTLQQHIVHSNTDSKIQAIRSKK